MQYGAMRHGNHSIWGVEGLLLSASYGWHSSKMGSNPPLSASLFFNQIQITNTFSGQYRASEVRMRQAASSTAAIGVVVKRGFPLSSQTRTSPQRFTMTPLRMMN